MTAITIEEAQAHLAEVIERLVPGEQLARIGDILQSP